MGGRVSRELGKLTLFVFPIRCFWFSGRREKVEGRCGGMKEGREE